MTPKGKLLRTVIRRAPEWKIVERRRNKIKKKLLKRSSSHKQQYFKVDRDLKVTLKIKKILNKRSKKVIKIALKVVKIAQRTKI